MTVHDLQSQALPAARRAPEPAAPVALSDAERTVIDTLRGIAHGHVEITLHGARIVQVTRTEKLRIDPPLSR